MAQPSGARILHITYSEQRIIPGRYDKRPDLNMIPLEFNRPAAGMPGIYDALLRLEQSRIRPLTFLDIGYAYMRFDFLDNGDNATTLMKTGVGIRVKPPLSLEWGYRNEKTIGNIRRSLFYYGGYFHEYYYFHDNRSAFPDFYSITAKIEF